MLLPEQPEAAVASLAVTAAAVCAPLNPACSADEFVSLAGMLRAKALILLAGATSPAIAAAKFLGMNILELVPAAHAPAGIFSLIGKDPVDLTGQSLVDNRGEALLLFTSGTEAQPKRVPLT